MCKWIEPHGAKSGTNLKSFYWKCVLLLTALKHVLKSSAPHGQNRDFAAIYNESGSSTLTAVYGHIR